MLPETGMGLEKPQVRLHRRFRLSDLRAELSVPPASKAAAAQCSERDIQTMELPAEPGSG